MISVLIPTRKRAAMLTRCIESMRVTAVGEVEAVLYIDEDDESSVQLARMLGVKYKAGPRRTLSSLWNECFSIASGDILQQGNDDVIYRTPAWDKHVEETFATCPDKILMVHCDNRSAYSADFGTHPFVHRKWVETLGYFTPPYFSSDYGDTWINALANAVGRRRFLPDVVEHMHYTLGKAEVDSTTKERLERHQRDNPGALYDRFAPQREADAAKLRTVMRAA